MLSEKEICKIICSNPPACTCTDNCPINFTIETVHKACEAQHKADLEEWKREKQEMWKELLTALQGREPIEALKIIRHKWGIE